MKKKNKYDLESLEKAAARVRAKLEDFDEKWTDKHKDELNRGGFFENPAHINQNLKKQEKYLYKKNQNNNESKLNPKSKKEIPTIGKMAEISKIYSKKIWEQRCNNRLSVEKGL